MDNILRDSIQAYYKTENIDLFLQDTLTMLPMFKEECIDMIFADPPYFLSNGGITCKGGKMVSVNKGIWDRISPDKETTIEEKHLFNRRWIGMCQKILKPNGTIWISGTLHNIYSVGMALEQEGFKIINNITWQKTNPPPNLACKCFTHSTETILWAKKNDKKSKQVFNYQLMKELNGGKQMKDVWTGSLTKPSEKRFGKHPTQKPEYLLERIILASTQPEDMVLDPFVGSGTTGVVAKRLKRRFIGIDNNLEYLQIAKKRLEDLQ
ncbi:MAG: site-specific DNA-methyltransferase [Lachnospiraceae bacterium]|jgi:site-specific DNA-methyltransferase (adenine-specific)|nr:site-specific DNA-methyltransferase [Lachnospiraceae bacterium]